jgi:hypothetical protein
MPAAVTKLIESSSAEGCNRREGEWKREINAGLFEGVCAAAAVLLATLSRRATGSSKAHGHIIVFRITR